MSGKKKIISITCGMLFLSVCAAAYIYTLLDRPLDPSLQLNLQKPPVPVAIQNENREVSLELNAEKAPSPQPVVPASSTAAVSGNSMPPVSKPAPVKTAQLKTPDDAKPSPGEIMNCGFSGVMNILFLGTDERLEYPYGADVIRFLRVDFSNLTVDCVDLSRDLWVKTPALADRKIKAARLGDVFDIAQMNTKGTIKEQYIAATTIISQTIFDNFGVAPDRYMTVPQSSFATLVDSLGGIEVEVPEDINAYNHVVLKGKRTLNGKQALSYIRQVDTFDVGDLGRNARQLPYMRALLEKMGLPANMVKLPGIIAHLQQNFVTDLSPARIASLACMLNQVPRGNISFHPLLREMTTPGPEASLLPDHSKIDPWLQNLLKK